MVPARVLFQRALKTSLLLIVLSWLPISRAMARIGPQHPRTIGATVGAVSEIDEPTKGGYAEVYWGKTLRSMDQLDFQVLLIANSVRFGHLEGSSLKHSEDVNQKIQANSMGFKTKIIYHNWQLSLSATGGRLQPKNTSPRRYEVLISMASLGYGLFVTDLNQLYLNINYLQVSPEPPWSSRYDKEKFSLITIGFGLDLFQIND